MAAIDTKQTQHSLFGNLKRAESNKQTQQQEETAAESQKENTFDFQSAEDGADSKTLHIPKWQSFDKVTALLTTEQKEGLDRVARKLMKHRSKHLNKKKDAERITTNTLIRALINSFLQNENKLEAEVLLSENDVYAWVSRHVKK